MWRVTRLAKKGKWRMLASELVPRNSAAGPTRPGPERQSRQGDISVTCEPHHENGFEDAVTHGIGSEALRLWLGIHNQRCCLWCQRKTPLEVWSLRRVSCAHREFGEKSRSRQAMQPCPLTGTLPIACKPRMPPHHAEQYAHLERRHPDGSAYLRPGNPTTSRCGRHSSATQAKKGNRRCMMVEFPIPESAAAPESQTSKKGQFGVALEPEVVRISGFALPVGQVPGLAAQVLLEQFIHLSMFSFTASSLRSSPFCRV